MTVRVMVKTTGQKHLAKINFWWCKLKLPKFVASTLPHNLLQQMRFDIITTLFQIYTVSKHAGLCVLFRCISDNISKNDLINSELFKTEKLLLYVTLAVIIAC